MLTRALLAAPLIALAVTSGAQADPAPAPVKLVVDGRPVLRATAVMRGGVVYVELGGIVRTFSGLVVFAGPKATVSVGARVASFVVGSSKANLDGTIVPIGGTTFEYDHDRYVPLNFIATRVARARVRINAAGNVAEITSVAGAASAIATATP